MEPSPSPSPARPTFSGASVLLFEARLATETAALVRRLGGEPLLAPALAEQSIGNDEEIAAFIDDVSRDPDRLVIFLTGVAVTRVFAAAERLGREADLVQALQRAAVLSRGPKPSGALARRQVRTTFTVPEPYTTAEVIQVLEGVPLARRPVTLVHYGERSTALPAMLDAHGARVSELMLYEWQLPSDPAPLSRGIDAVAAGWVAVVAFTSQVQVRHALAVAGEGRREAFIRALNQHAIVGAIGPTCAAACAAHGIEVGVVPEHPKLAPLLTALAAAYEARRRDQTSPPAKEPE